jgi:hypothetical protein
MHEKQIRSLALKISKLKAAGGKSTRYPQKIWDQVNELLPYFYFLIFL